jgi:hypothetical protein
MFALKRSVSRPTLRQCVKSLAASTAKILRFPARAEVVGTDPGRRRLMTGTIAAAAVVPLPAFGGGGPGGLVDDPIFAAIENHKAALTASQAIIAEKEDAWEAFRLREGDAPDRGYCSEWLRFCSAEGAALVPQQTSALKAEECAFQAILAVMPSTQAGLVALARYACELEGHEDWRVTAERPGYRILAALAGIPEEEDEGDEDDD